MGFKPSSFLIIILATSIAEDLLAIVKNESPILSPSAEEPAEVEPGDTITSQVRMRLPLTPPPGVQQPAAKTGWYATLIRDDAIAKKGDLSTLAYTASVVRYRPESGEIYRVTIKTNPWMPPGKYDLVLTAPGMDTTSPKAVWIKDTKHDDESTLSIRTVRQNTVEAINSSPSKTSWQLDLVVPEDIPGYDVMVDGKPMEPSVVTMAGDTPEDGSPRRLLQFEIEVPGAVEGKEGKRTVYWSPVNNKECKASIRLVGDKDEIDPTIQTPLFFTAKNFDPAYMAWDFGDGAKEVGEKVNHLFMLTEYAKVRAFAFDLQGRICFASAEFKVAVPLERDNCSCELAGKTKSSSLLGFFLGFLGV